MKLEKIIKNVDGIACNVKMFVEDELVYDGSLLSLQVVAEGGKELEDYIAECEKDEDYKTIKEVAEGKKWINYKLDKSGIPNWYPIDIRTEKNKHGVVLPIMYIIIKK